MDDSTPGETALVTGVGGFIGSHLARSVLERGDHVVGLDNLETGSAATIDSLEKEQQFRFILGDIRDEDVLRSVLKDVDVVYHQAAVTSIERSFEEPAATTDINCTGTATLLSAVRDTDIDELVVASSASVYGSSAPQPVPETATVDPQSPYATSKFCTERLALQVGDSLDTNVNVLRYFNVYGPGQDPSGSYAAVVPSFVSHVRDGTPPVIYGDGAQTRDFIHVRDVVGANIAVAAQSGSGEIYNVGSGEQTSIVQLAETILSMTGSQLEPTFEPPRSGDVRHSCADISKLRDHIGFEPSVDIQTGLQGLLADDPSLSLGKRNVKQR